MAGEIHVRSRSLLFLASLLFFHPPDGFMIMKVLIILKSRGERDGFGLEEESALWRNPFFFFFLIQITRTSASQFVDYSKSRILVLPI